ncbi:uncharacterized protein VNE69_08136 [Vairimorpha necatrix]|uniref:Uncharacterized protein n=1 Tax=Vairimorpha necatrix TaxID=6039 RepID=A0AAX4JER1_9MICR
MEDAELLIKELRIDNESLLSPNYNPLIQMYENKKSTMSFRNTYHRVEKVMENIINLTYKGFSDSVLSYMEVYNINKKNILLLSDVLSSLSTIHSTSFNTEDVVFIYNNTKYLKYKCDVVDSLVELNELVNNKSGESSSSNLFRAKEIIKENKLYCIEGIDLLRNEIIKEINRVMTRVYSKVQEYIYKDKIENKEYLRIIKVYKKIDEFDKYLLDNSTRYNIEDIDDVISNISYINDYFGRELSITSKLLEKSVSSPVSDDNTFMILEDEVFTKVDLVTNTLVFLRYISDTTNINILCSRIREIYRHREITPYLINTLVLVNKRYNSEKITVLIDKYSKIINTSTKEEVMYLFDMFYREGDYTSDYYIKKIIKTIIKEEDIINVGEIVKKMNEYIKKEVDKTKSSGAWREKIYLLDEILAEYTDEALIL